jgi:hypothetical protein
MAVHKYYTLLKMPDISLNLEYKSSYFFNMAMAMHLLQGSGGFLSSIGLPLDSRRSVMLF